MKQKKTAFLIFRVTQSEKDDVNASAKKNKVNPSTHLRNIVSNYLLNEKGK